VERLNIRANLPTGWFRITVDSAKRDKAWLKHHGLPPGQICINAVCFITDMTSRSRGVMRPSLA
jgi:hypothetical protein